jgi:hypothetical protein
MKTKEYWIMRRDTVLRNLHSPILRRKVLELPTHDHCGELYVHETDVEELLTRDRFRALGTVVSTLILDEDVPDMENQLEYAEYTQYR